MRNPDLFNRLKKYVDPKVEVVASQAGMPFEGRLAEELKFEGGEVQRYSYIDPGSNKGEEYRLSCPFCGDTKKRLYVNHMFGTKAARKLPVNTLINCFNDQCFKGNSLRRQAFMSRLRLGSSSNIQSTIDIKLVDVPEENIIRKPADLPTLELEDAEIVTLSSLYARDRNHKALKYIRYRFLDFKVLEEKFKVRYINSCWDNPGYQGRLYCPILHDGRAVGWQARLVRKPRYEDELRWMTGIGTKAGMCLYNWDNAKSKRIKIIVEGPSDVWNIGDNAVGCFKKSISRGQRDLLVTTHQDSNVYVVMLDPERPKNEVDKESKHHIDMAVEMLQRVRQLQGRVIPVWLPLGQDPGSIDRRYAYSLIKKELKGAGLWK
jgi:hypothetical protein